MLSNCTAQPTYIHTLSAETDEPLASSAPESSLAARLGSARLCLDVIADVLIHALQTATCTRPDESRGYHSLSCGADRPGLLKFRRCFPSANAIHLFLMPQLFLHPHSTSKIDDTDTIHVYPNIP